MTRRVPPDGPRDAKIVFIGEAPGAYEDELGKPFMGKAGSVLETCLHAAGLVRSEVYLTNLVKFRPPSNNISGYFDKGMLTAKGLVAQAELKEELSELSANVFVPLGNAALYALTGKVSITKRRGSILLCTLLPGRKVIPTIHPASVLYGNFMVTYHIAEDIKFIVQESDSPLLNLPRRNLILGPTLSQSLAYMEAARGFGRVAFDIEVIGGQVSLISFSYEKSSAICIPLTDYTLEEEVEAWKGIAAILGDPEVVKQGQNLIFDTHFILDKNNIITRGPIEDTMIAHHIIYPDFPKGLDFLTSLHTREPYYKDEGKQWKMKQIKDMMAFQGYSAKDSVVIPEIWDAILPQLKDGHMSAYQQTIDLFPSLTFMMLDGLAVDKEAIKILKTTEQARETAALTEIQKLIGPTFNPMSPKQCMEYFYIKKGITPYTSRQTGKPTIDDKALQRLARGTKSRKPLREATLIQTIRSTRKLIGTYLDIEIDPDGRFRCSYNPRGTTTGRLSSSKTIAGTGMNHQNLPEIFRRFIIPDEGYFFLEVDKVQAEWVVVAYMTGDANMLRIVESGLDAHVETGHLISLLPREYIVAENEYCKHTRNPIEVEEAREAMVSEHPAYDPFILRASHPGGFLPRTMSVRQVGKHSNHGLNYIMGANRFSEEYEVPYEEADRIVKGYHRAYPGIPIWHKWVGSQLIDHDRTICNLFGRKRVFLEEWGDKLIKDAVAFGPQSTIADVVLRAQIKLYNTPDPRWKPVKISLNGHDSLLFQIPLALRDKIWVINHIFDEMDPELEAKGRTFHVKSSAKVGFNWRDMVELPEVAEKDLMLGLEKARTIHEESRRVTVQ